MSRRQQRRYFQPTMNEAPYRQARFLLGAHTLAQLPPDTGREVAFAGRSNSGKSSVLNALVANRRLARISKTPGRTQQINFFALADNLRLVDLPGYGYAHAPGSLRRMWGRTITGYLESRRSLCGIIIIMDVRHPLTELDRQMVDWGRAGGRPVHLLLNKSDKLSGSAARRVLQKVSRDSGLEGTGVQLFSTVRRTGVRALQLVVDQWLLGSADKKKNGPGL